MWSVPACFSPHPLFLLLFPSYQFSSLSPVFRSFVYFDWLSPSYYCVNCREGREKSACWIRPVLLNYVGTVARWNTSQEGLLSGQKWQGSATHRVLEKTHLISIPSPILPQILFYHLHWSMESPIRGGGSFQFIEASFKSQTPLGRNVGVQFCVERYLTERNRLSWRKVYCEYNIQYKRTFWVGKRQRIRNVQVPNAMVALFLLCQGDPQLSLYYEARSTADRQERWWRPMGRLKSHSSGLIEFSPR